MGKMEMTRNREEAEGRSSGFNDETWVLSSWLLHGLREPWRHIIAGRDGKARAPLRSTGDGEARA